MVRDGRDSSQAGLETTPKPLAAFALLLAKTGRAYSQTKSVDTLKHFSLTLTLWLTPGNSQLGEMPSCTSNRHSTGICLDRPEHRVYPAEGWPSLPSSPSTVTSWSPFA